MNTIFYYRETRDEQGRVTKIEAKPVRLNRRRGSLLQADRFVPAGFTRRRPNALVPHHRKPERPGYRQPTQQQLRRARQQARARRAA